MKVLRKAPILVVKNTTRHLMNGSLIEEKPTEVRIVVVDRDLLLIRYTADGIGIADTWHETESEAIDQAEFEYVLGPWKVP